MILAVATGSCSVRRIIKEVENEKCIYRQDAEEAEMLETEAKIQRRKKMSARKICVLCGLSLECKL